MKSVVLISSATRNIPCLVARGAERRTAKLPSPPNVRKKTVHFPSQLIYLLGTLVICNINKMQTTYFRSPFCESTLHVISIDDLLLFSPSHFPRVYKPPALRSLRPGASLSPSTTFERSSSCPLYSAKKHTRLLFS